MRQSLRAAVRTPEPLARRLFGEPPKNDCGAPLDRQVHILLQMMDNVGSPKLEELGAYEARQVYRRANQTFDLAPCEMHSVEDRQIVGPGGDIGLRIYRPVVGELPGVVFYHGGGFVIGDLDGYDGFCRAFAERTGCLVVSVDYRLAPEHPFPAAVDDCVQAFRWVRANAGELNVDREQIAVAGDSAGANLATVVCQQQIVADEPTPARQLLLYPKVDQQGDYPCRKLFGHGFFLTDDMICWFSQCYLKEADKSDPRASPIVFDRLGEMPPAMIVTAGFDPLRDEGEVYAARLGDAGVDVSYRCQDELVHGFITMGGIVDAAAQAVADIAEEFRCQLRA